MMKKKVTALLLVLVLALSLLPVSAFAAGSDLKCSISLKLAEDYSAYVEQFNAFNKGHKAEIKEIQPTIEENTDSTIISWTVPDLEGWKVTGAQFIIMDNTGDRVRVDGTSRELPDGTYASYDTPYTLSENTITLTYTGDFNMITEIGEESGIAGKITLYILIAPVEKKTTASVTYSYVNQSEERVSSDSAEWLAIADPSRNPSQTEVLPGTNWTIPLNNSIVISISGNIYESWKLTGCVVTIVTTDGEKDGDESAFIPVEDLQDGYTVHIPDTATAVNVAYYWMISGVTNIIESVDEVVKQNENPLAPREENVPHTYVVNGKANVTVDYTATMDMTKLDSKFGADSWAWLNQRYAWITDKTTVLLHFTFDSNLDVAKANWKDAKLESDMFVLADGNFCQVDGQNVTVTCKWSSEKAAAARESKDTLNHIITFTGVTIPVKNNWEGDTAEITSSGYVDGTVYASISQGNNTTYNDQGGIYGGYKSNTFVLTTQATLSYDANGGTGSMDSQTQIGTVGTGVTVADNGFTRGGYTFTGWNTAKEGNGTAYQPGDSFTLLAEDTVLYAQWSKKTTRPTTPTTSTPISSPKTFDAGIALYAGMALLSVTGSAVLVGKRKKF